jgi:hypothetical protein
MLTLLVRRPGAVSPLVLGAVTAAAGAFTPPLGPTMRAVWSRLAPDRALLQRAYSLDGVAEELLFVSGPLLVGVLVGFAPPMAGIVFGTALIVAGTGGFVSSPAVGAVRPVGVDTGQRRVGPGAAVWGWLRGLFCGREGAGRSLLRALLASRGGAERGVVRGVGPGRGAVAQGWLRGLFPWPGAAGRSVLRRVRPRRDARPGALRGILQPVVAAAGVGLTLGLVDLVVVAFAERRHYGDGAVAWTLAALSAGSAVGGLVNGAVDWRLPARARLFMTVAGLGVALLGAGLAPGLGALAVALAVAGVFVSPALTTAYLIADDAAAPEARVRAGAWVNTGVNAGSTAGAAAAGLLVGGLPTALCFAAAGAAALLTAAVVARGAPERGAPPEAGVAGGGVVVPVA